MRFFTLLCVLFLTLAMTACGGMDDGSGGTYPIGTDYDCTDTPVCQSQGRCTHAGGDKCVATRESDCNNSDYCDSHGLCTLVSGKCVAASDEDCKQAMCCKLHMQKECVAKDGECVY